jgi:hypothetical protein
MRPESVVAGGLMIAEDEFMPRILFQEATSSRALAALSPVRRSVHTTQSAQRRIAQVVGGFEIFRGKQTDMVRPLTAAL